MKNKQKLLVIGGSILAVIGVTVGILAAVAGSGKKPVYVYSYDIVGMGGGFWGDSKQSYGTVRSDNIQTVMLSDTQTVTAINVKEGDVVKKDDVLMTFDSTLSELALEKKRLAVEQLKLRLEQEKDRLKEINNLQPYVPVQKTYTYTWVESTGVNGFKDDEMFVPNGSTDPKSWTGPMGTGENDAVILWMRNGYTMTNDIFEFLAQFLEKARSTWVENNYQMLYDDYLKALREWEENDGTPENQPQEPVKPVSENIRDYYLILKQTADNNTASTAQVFFGMHASKNGAGVWSFIPFDASYLYDYTKTGVPAHGVVSGGGDDEEESTDPAYTLEQIVQMRQEQQKTILDVEYRIKVAEAEYSIALRETKDGNVRAEVDGKVISVLTPEEAKEKQQPVIKVSGGGGYYVVGSISELERDQLAIGSEVTITDNRTGNMCTGTVESIGDYPTRQEEDGNVSYYPFNVFVDESADLVGGNFVNISYALEEDETGIYLTNAFVRKENGQNFVYVRGEDGKLKKRAVTVGKSLWGSYKQILSGATEADRFAFPYGKNVKEGAATQDGDYTTLYGA